MLYSAQYDRVQATPWRWPPNTPSRVLIVEDDPTIGHIIRALLEKRDIQVAVADGGEQGLLEAQTNPPDLIIMDVLMPDMDGFTAARRLQEDERTWHIPIIFVTALGHTDQIIKGLDLGAVDYITKPFRGAELVARINAALRLKSIQDGLRQANAELASLALVDSMTGLHNHRYIMEMLSQALHHAARYGEALTALMLDLDHFKQVNDTYGHHQGDLVLRELAGVLRRSVRASDDVGRYGGEEFVVVCPSTDQSAGLQLAERIRQTVQAHPFSGPEGRLSITVSLGCATYDQARDASGEALLKRADAALYRAKRDGRNCVRVSKNPAH